MSLTDDADATGLSERAFKARALTVELVEHLSVTGTQGEASCAHLIHAMLARIPYFESHPHDVRTLPVPGAPEGRSNVVGLVRGSGRRTVVLAGHFDVVGVDNYFALSGLAHRPEALAQAMREALGTDAKTGQVAEDLASGAFLPGRGVLDMKSGLAAGMVALEAFSQRPDRVGNLIFLACPDEENQSAGMRAAGPALRLLAEEHGLDLSLLINLDALLDEAEGEAGQVVGLGCIGKHLVSALVVGREAHACYPFTGINAAYLAAALTVEVEAHPSLAERVGEEALAPPTALYARDLKPSYDVTTPERAWCAWNVLVYERSAKAVMDALAGIAGDVARSALSRLAERADATGLRFSFGPDSVAVITYEELHAAALARDARAFGTARTALAERLAADPNASSPDIARALTELAVAHAGLTGPAIVLGFASLSYPAVPTLGRRGMERLEATVRAAAKRIEARMGTQIGFVQALPIICDMSFAAPAFDSAGHRHATQNNPLSDAILAWDTGASADLPAVNIGPWGRDYHHRFERVNVRYAFEVLPELVLETADAVLAMEGSTT